MSVSDVLTRLEEVPMPKYYFDYYNSLTKKTFEVFEIAAKAKATLLDSSGIIEPKIAFDLADRVAKMHEIDISEPLRELLKTKGKELSALKMAEDIANGKYLPENTALEQKLDLAVRVGLAIVTEGVTIAPLQGISEVKIKKNKDGSDYLSVSIAGPMRSAGGTESAVTILIADYVRKIANLSKYQANCFDDETGRFVEELRIYETEAKQSFQFHVTDDDIIKVISNLPVELDGEGTDPDEIVNHRNMTRIKSNRVRGGALRVLNDGLIGRSKKLLKRIEMYDLDGWDWLTELKGGIQTGNEEDAAAKRMKEVITGRSVLSMPGKLGGFRLRYGRSYNTGFAAVGIHPAIAEILDHTIAVGTQIKLDIPGKGATIGFVDSIETPIVRLENGNVIKIKDVDHAIKIKNKIQKILHLGDILISFGDFLENNSQLVPSAYVEEIWNEELKLKINKLKNTALEKFLFSIPTVDEAFKISYDYGLPLHPKFLYYWDKISNSEFKKMLKPSIITDKKIIYPYSAKTALEILGIPHTQNDDSLELNETDTKIIHNLLFTKTLATDDLLPIPMLITKISGVKIRNKFSTSVGVRIGRPEKYSPRQMKPSVHCLFPVGDRGGIFRDILKASNHPHFSTYIQDRECQKCNEPSLSIICQKCNVKTSQIFTCRFCREKTNLPECQKCNKKSSSYQFKTFPLKEKLRQAQNIVGIRAKEPLKGVIQLINQDRIAEPLEKGIIRQSLSLSVFKDGTVRFDATNSPLTHFKPSWIGTSVDDLKKLGYTHDVDSSPLTHSEQILELRMQDIIIPTQSGEFLVNSAKYIDKELEKLFKKSSFYNVKEISDLIGHLLIGLAPHTSVGIVGRIIGFTKTHVCFATPIWHSAKRRDADGDADSMMLLMDSLMNFSRQFLSDKIGGLMDAPLLIQPQVLPHESQPQAHNFEVTKQFPLSFFEATYKKEKSSNISDIDILEYRLNKKSQFFKFDCTHHTTTLTTSKTRSAYSTLDSMLDKLDLQIKNADKINCIDVNEIVSNVITTHLIPDIMGNVGAYARQKFRCTSCGTKYRRMPLQSRCKCGNKLISTISKGSVIKYLSLAKRLVQKYTVSEYLSNRIFTLSDEIELVFGKNKDDQALLTDYVN